MPRIATYINDAGDVTVDLCNECKGHIEHLDKTLLCEAPQPGATCEECLTTNDDMVPV